MKNISGKTMIFYTFQSGSKNVEFNVTTFKKSAPQEPKIRDVLYELPLDFMNNSFHFRFRSEFFEGDEKIIGWIDISNLLAKVPIINNSIFVKILKLPGDRENKLFNKQKLKAIGLIEPQGHHVHHATNSAPKPTVNIQTPTTPKQQTVHVKKNNNNLFDFEESPKKSHSQIKSANKTAQKVTKQTQNDGKKPYIPGSETQAQILKRFQDQCKNQEHERTLQHEAIGFHEQKLNQWGYSGHKTINNLTTLLATLHTIWPQWTAVSLTQMLTPQSVTQVYRKAVIKLHPDKNVDKDYKTKYLAKRIFELLNEAKKAQNK